MRAVPPIFVALTVDPATVTAVDAAEFSPRVIPRFPPVIVESVMVAVELTSFGEAHRDTPVEMPEFDVAMMSAAETVRECEFTPTAVADPAPVVDAVTDPPVTAREDVFDEEFTPTALDVPAVEEVMVELSMDRFAALPKETPVAAPVVAPVVVAVMVLCVRVVFVLEEMVKPVAAPVPEELAVMVESDTLTGPNTRDAETPVEVPAVTVEDMSQPDSDTLVATPEKG